MKHPDELAFTRHLMLALGRHPSLRIWRQNCGKVPVRDQAGKLLRIFDPGPPTGAADISGIVRPEGWRLEIELKSPTGKRSDEQVRWAKFIEQSGGVYALVAYDDSTSLEQNLERSVSEVLARISYRRSTSTTTP